jgi:hypothetical protein
LPAIKTGYKQTNQLFSLQLLKYEPVPPPSANAVAGTVLAINPAYMIAVSRQMAQSAADFKVDVIVYT